MTAMTKDELLAQMEDARAEWDHLLVEVGQDRMGELLDPEDPDGLTTRDLIVHFMVTEQSLVNAIRTGVVQEPRESDGHSPSHTMPLAVLLRTAEEVFDDLIAAVQDVPDEQIVDPAAFSWTDGLALLDVVARRTIEHYQQYEPALRVVILAHDCLEHDPDDPVDL